ncbi:hypothetical protein CAEBREN_28558 [Caenorhabditis brenneri]|uniref:Major facilitator superfamily (MFS) profile domain-containing protein n=1 Tax=Caenorhabditis brenneri TaxID=135651 RepID=G0PHZ0_CAEBE|nr:hypothetical protein CAEBREN_28558 [Caenorhabditis brenneri]
MQRSTESALAKGTCFIFRNNTRIYVLFLTLICITFIQMNTLTFNFTVICMQDIVEHHYQIANNTETHWFEGSTEKSLLFSAAAIGGVIGLIPVVPLINTLGFRNVQTISGLISALGVLLFPLAVHFGFYTSFLCRVFQGIGSSIMFTTVGVVPSVWAPNSEINTFMAVLSCAYQLSNILCMPVSGFLCESALGWRSIYYLFGVLTALIYVIFWLTYTDDPSENRNVSKEELMKISTGKVEKIKKPVPYKKICTDKTVIMTWISTFGGNMGFYVLSLYGPTYLREVLNKFSAGQISDKLKFLSEKTRFVFFAATSQFGLASGLAAMALTSNRYFAQAAFNFAIVCSGMNIMGVIKCAQLRTRQHVHFALVVISFIGYAVLFLAPIIVSIICPDNTAEQWTTLFLFVTGTIIVCNVGFPFLTKSEAAEYTKKIESTIEKCSSV